jgi:hypothetical protein
MKQQTALKYPDTWTESTVNTFERLHSLGHITQADVDEIEERLQWFRGWRDYFATTGGRDETLIDQDYVA